MSIRRRWTLHVPQLVGRISYPQHGEEAHAASRRLVGEFDTAMQELQRFLKYLQDSQDESTGDGRSYTLVPEAVDTSAGAVGDPDLGWSPGSHKHKAATGIPVGLGNANAEGSGIALAREDHVHKRTVRVKRGPDVGTRNALNFSADFTVSDDLINDEVDIALSAVGHLIVEEVDGVPSVVSVATLQFDQADGFVVSSPLAGVAKVKLTAATPVTAYRRWAFMFGGR